MNIETKTRTSNELRVLLTNASAHGWFTTDNMLQTAV